MFTVATNVKKKGKYMKNILSKLLKVQSELKAPKGQYNNFGKYKYRSAEDILEAVKPIAHSHNSVVNLSDEMVAISERYYIKATATISDVDSGESYSVTAYAREEENKKGMDGSQITGTASSYARKYAMNGLFAIDDTKDPDTDEHAKQTKEDDKEDDKKETKATAKQVELIKSLLNNVEAHIEYTCTQYNVKNLKELTMKQASEVVSKIKAKQGK
jgi:hypothetical protein